MNQIELKEETQLQLLPIIFSCKTGKVPANTKIIIKDDSDNVLFETTPSKQFQSIVVSLESFNQGDTYTIQVGSVEQTVTLNNILTNVGNSGMGGQGGPGGPGGRPPRW